MSEYTLNDLVEESGNAASSAANSASSEETGEWLMDFYEKMRDDGYLDPLMEQLIGEPRDMNEIQQEHQQQKTAGEAANTTSDTSTGAADELSADDVKNLMLELYDHAEQIPGLSEDPTLSELIQLIDANPEMADKLMDQYI